MQGYKMAKGEVVLVIACMLVTWHGFMNLLLKKENGGAIGLTAVQHPVGGGGSSQQHPSVTTNTVPSGYPTTTMKTVECWLAWDVEARQDDDDIAEFWIKYGREAQARAIRYRDLTLKLSSLCTPPPSLLLGFHSTAKDNVQ
eukprot:53806_1